MSIKFGDFEIFEMLGFSYFEILAFGLGNRAQEARGTGGGPGSPGNRGGGPP